MSVKPVTLGKDFSLGVFQAGFYSYAYALSIEGIQQQWPGRNRRITVPVF